MSIKSRLTRAKKAAQAAGVVDNPDAWVAKYDDSRMYHKGQPISDDQLRKLEETHNVNTITITYVTSWPDGDGGEHTAPGTSSWPPGRIQLKWPEDE